MKHFPDFMKNIKNQVDPSQQNTDDIEGYYFEGKDDSQIAFWECRSDRISKKHTHPTPRTLLFLRAIRNLAVL